MQKNIAIIVSQYNKTITERLLTGAISHLQQNGIDHHHIAVVKVPGAVEIPLAAQLCAKQHRYHAIICLGAVIRGDTDHYEYVCRQVSDGCQQVMLEYEIPVIFGVLTTHNEDQAFARSGGDVGHKGEEAALAALMMIDVVAELQVVVESNQEAKPAKLHRV